MTNNQLSCDCHDGSMEHDRDHSETKVVLNCGTGSGVSIPVGGEMGIWQPCLTVGTVVLDTRGFQKPTVKIDYSSVVSFTADTSLFNIELVFQLSRACDHGQKIPLANWTYQREVGYNSTNFAEAREVMGYIDIEFKDPIAFTWCECHECPGCCTYVVELISVTAIDIACATITNVGINAIAVSS